MKIAQIIDVIEKLAPLCDAEEWDRVGLMIGSAQRECDVVLTTLDVTPAVVDEAIECGAQLIASHHPFIWDRLSSIDVDKQKGAMIEKLVKHDIAVYSAHTNLDKAEDGINVRLATLFGGKNIARDGLGATFDVEETTLKSLAEHVASRLGDDTVLYAGDEHKKITRAYVVGGAGGSEYARARQVADVLITGELKHNQFAEAEGDGFCLVQFSHYHSEKIARDIFFDALANLPIKVIKAAQACPFRRINIDEH